MASEKLGIGVQGQYSLVILGECRQALKCQATHGKTTRSGGTSGSRAHIQCRFVSDFQKLARPPKEPWKPKGTPKLVEFREMTGVIEQGDQVAVSGTDRVL
jgi:hypothetical protein